jgi:alkanesulfonate monooxygenase SsuD/methylene tetrahydromethanopterin reductase-like flavin-dependent oxidoreductase (luciferase family)
MAHEVRFQVGILPDVEWKSFIGRLQHFEALGFDMAGTGDQFVDSMDHSRPWFDLWAALAAVAKGTESLRIAPHVAQIPMRDPATLARQVLTVDHISNGRVEVGLGLGRPVAASYRMMGIPNWDNAERVERFGEHVESSNTCCRTRRRPTKVATTESTAPRCIHPSSHPAHRSRSLQWDRR